MKHQDEKHLYEFLESTYFGEEMQEVEEIEALKSILSGVSIFVDAGASLGQYAYYADKELSNAQIICIEADSLRVKRLAELVSKWSANSSNKIEAIHAAVSNENGEATFYETNHDLCGGLDHYWKSEDFSGYDDVIPRAVQVRCLTLDSLFEDKTPDLIKIDVEGAEYRAVSGASEILKRRKTRFAVEMHPWGDRSLGKKTSDVFQVFYDNGYDFERLHKLWHFFPSDRHLSLWPKYKFTQIVMNSDRLRKLAKRILRRKSG